MIITTLPLSILQAAAADFDLPDVTEDFENAKASPEDANARKALPIDINAYPIPILVGSKRQDEALLSPFEEQNINTLLQKSQKIGLVRFASVLVAKGAGFSHYTSRYVFLVYGPTRHQECRVKIQKTLLKADIKNCDPVVNVHSVQYAYIKYNNMAIALSLLASALARAIQLASFALPFSLSSRNN